MDRGIIDKVLTEDLEVKSCGREACKDLIAYLSSLYPDTYFGDIKTGFLNMDNVKKVVQDLEKRCI